MKGCQLRTAKRSVLPGLGIIKDGRALYIPEIIANHCAIDYNLYIG